MKRLVVTDRARRDARFIMQYYKRKAGTADWFVQKLEDATAHLLRWPLSGEVRIDLKNEPVRLWLINPYYVIYSVDGDILTLLAIIHAARDMSSIIRDTHD